MGILDSLKRAFAGQPASRDDGIYFYVRCDRCGDHVQVRISPQNELQQEFDGGGVSGYFVRKTVIDQRCFRPIETYLTFDTGRRELTREIESGMFVTREEYEAATGQG